MFFNARIISSMEKVFCREELDAEILRETGGARGETVSFQIACRCREALFVRIRLESPLAEITEIREVGYLPSMNPADPRDPDVITHEPGLFPCPLLPCPGYLKLSRNHYHCFWVSVRIPEHADAGTFPMKFILDNQEMPVRWLSGTFSSEVSLNFRIYNFTLPKQTLKSINWFHTDCLMTWYRMKCWSEEFWNLLEKYFKNMLEHGNNVLFTPLWTPPLDTSVGGERPTVQLLEISRENGIYRFDFKNLKRWLDTARKIGFEFFEMSHLFTQWGAEFTPKIIVNGEKRFGWHVRADSTEYSEFLSALLPALETFLRNENLTGKCYFHISDEPQSNHLKNYMDAAALVKKYLNTDDFPLIDALSDIKLAKEAGLSRPVPVTNHWENFSQEHFAERWVYYCGNWNDGVPNRSFGMPSTRNRIMGVLLYLNRIDGFLHWGYNFWFSQYSLNTNLNPYQNPDAERAFLGGDSFNVMPGADGPVDTLHFEVFREGFQDQRALQLLESRIGRERTAALIHEGLGYSLSMTRYPMEKEWLPELRKKINEMIEKSLR